MTKIIITILSLGIIAMAFSIQQPQIGGDVLISDTRPIVKRILINTGEDLITIKDQIFIQGEWVHVDEEWYQKNLKALESYPIKEASTILEDKLRASIEEKGLDGFAQGIKEASLDYNQPLPSVADEVLKIKPYEK